MTAPVITEGRTIHVSVRESRLVVDRLLLTLGLSKGFIPAVREAVLLSQSMDLGGFSHLHDSHGILASPGPDAIRVQDEAEGSLIIEGQGIHAWLLLPTITDLAVDLARRFGRAKLAITGAQAMEELLVMSALARRHGAHAELSRPAGKTDNASVVCMTVSNRSRPRTLEQWDPLLFAAMRDGFAVDESMWRTLYDLSNRALAPDSVVSRRHAGPVILLDDGTIVGRPPADDDFDPTMLQLPDPSKIQEGRR